MKKNVAYPIFLLVVCISILPSACKKDAEHGGAQDANASGGVEDLTIVVEADKSRILQEENALKARKEDFETERANLEKQRAEVAQRLASISQSDKTQRERLEAAEQSLADQQKSLRSRSDTFESERAKLEAEKNQLLDRIGKMTQTKGGLTIEQREEAIARREAAVALREKEVAARESAAARGLADIKAVLDEVKEDAAGIGKGASSAAAAAAAAAAANAGISGPPSKVTVAKLEKQIHTKMDTKGILLDDLPPSVRALSSTATTSSTSHDYASAQDSLAQMQQAVDAIAINHAFVQAKMARINRQFEDKKVSVDDGKQKKIQGLLAEASDSFSDGRYDRANKKINQIYALLQGK